jgi:hypothetical protein
MDSPLIRAREATSDPRDCRKTIDALRDIGFRDDAFRALHHQHGSAARFYSYCGGVRLFEEDRNNHRVHQRLVYVLLACPGAALPKGTSFLTLAEEAFRLIPPVELS